MIILNKEVGVNPHPKDLSKSPAVVRFFVYYNPHIPTLVGFFVYKRHTHIVTLFF